MTYRSQFGSAVVVALQIACSNSDKSHETMATSREMVTSPSSLTSNDCAPGRTCAMNLVFPAGVSSSSAWVAARQKVTIGDRVNLTGGSVATVGTSGVFLGTDVVAQSVISQGTVELRDRAQVTSQLLTPVQPVVGNQTTIPAGFQPSSIQPFSTTIWAFTYPPDSATPISAISGQTQPISPGIYRELVIQNGGTVVLSAGSYTFRSIQFEPDGHLRLPSGNVLVNVASDMTLRGHVDGVSGTYDWTVIYGSKDPLIIEQGFKGTLLAPQASLTLRGAPAQYAASVYADSVTIEAGASFSFVQSQVPTMDAADCIKLLRSQQADPNAYPSPQTMFDILRLCQAPQIPDCYARFMAAANSDRHSAAQQYVAKLLDTSGHLALIRDRSRKAKQMRHDPTRLADYCKGDADGDLVPDAEDKCPQTPPMTPTDDSGCTSTAAAPVGPSREMVDNILTHMGILHNPACDSQSGPAQPGTIDLFSDVSGHRNTKFIVSPLPQWGVCPLWYEIRATVYTSSGTSHSFHYSIPLSDSTFILPPATCVGTDGQSQSCGPWTIGFDMSRASASSEEQNFASQQVSGSKVLAEARAFDGNGRMSDWTLPQIISVP